MVWTLIFQLVTVFVFIRIFCNDKHNQAIVSRKKRFWYSILLFIGTDFLLRFFLVKKSQILILHNIFGVSGILLAILDVIKINGFIAIFLYLVVMPIFLIFHFPSFLIFWIWFSKNKRIKIITTILYILWSATSIWLCVTFPDREQSSAQLRVMLEEKQTQEIRQKVEHSTHEENIEKAPPKQ